MEKIKFTVDSGHAGSRLDKFLTGMLETRFSRTFIKKLIDGKTVFIDGKNKNAHYKVLKGETIEVTIPEAKPLELTPENIPLEILYEDKDLMVVNKPAGISVHPSGPNLTGTLVNALLYYAKDLSGIGGVARPGIVHRLDKDTSGVLVVAKNDNAHINLSGQFRNKTAKRKYVAVVRGMVQLDNGKIELPIARRKKDITKMGVSFADPKTKKAVTNYKVIKRFNDFTVLELSLETGRTHQIRVHLSYMGHPVIGDKMYGSHRGLSRQALHAKTLGFFHPVSKKYMEFTSPIPSDMENLIKKGAL